MKFKNRLAVVLAVLITLSSCFGLYTSAEEDAPSVPTDPGITSGNAIVAYSLDDDQLLYSNRLEEEVSPAVATKLVNAMVVMDLLNERGLNYSDVIVTVTAAAVENSGNVYDLRVPIMGFEAGDTCSVKDMLSSMLVAGANDAASALACHFGEAFLGGDMTSFVNKMNDKCQSLGLENTHFVNATGIYSPEQKTTPYETALIAAAFYGYNDLVTLSDVEYFRYKDRVTIRNESCLKNGHSYSGYTNKNAISLIAGHLDVKGNYCLIAASQKEGKTYIFVVMCATGLKEEVVGEVRTYHYGVGNAYDDMNLLIDWTREAFSLVTLATKSTIIGELRLNLGNSSDHVMVVPAEDVERLVLGGNAESIQMQIDYDYESNLVYKTMLNDVEHDTINAPVSAGQRVGTVTFKSGDTVIAQVDAVVKEGVEMDSIKAFLSRTKSFLFGDVMMTVIWVIVGCIAVYFLVVIITAFIKMINKTVSLTKGKGKKEKTAKKPKEKSKKPKKKKEKQQEAFNEDIAVLDNSSTREMGQ